MVAIGENIEASIFVYLHLKNGVEKFNQSQIKVTIWFLSHLGISKIIHPEEDMGVRIAQSLCYPMVSRYMALEDNHYIVKIEIDENYKGLASTNDGSSTWCENIIP